MSLDSNFNRDDFVPLLYIRLYFDLALQEGGLFFMQNWRFYERPDDAAAPLDLSVAAAAHGLSKNPENDFLEFTSVNSGRRRSVFLAEERDFETQADMTVVDPVKVTGVNG